MVDATSNIATLTRYCLFGLTPQDLGSGTPAACWFHITTCGIPYRGA